MTFEQGAIVVIGSVTSALCLLAKILWNRSEQCEVDRVAIRIELEKVKEDRGLARGELKAFERCPSDSCPFREEDR